MRALYLLVAAVSYAAFFATFVYFVGFVAGFDLLPTHVDKGLSASPGTAALVDIGLIALFGLQHSVMARKGFKQGLTRVLPTPIERSFYCLATAVVLSVMYAFWHPIAIDVWNVTAEPWSTILWTLFGLGFLIVFISTWLINHFELFGLAQAWHGARGEEAPAPRFRTPLFYKLVRHPIYTGFAIALWSTPHMTLGHLLLAAGMTVYLLVGISYEERDLLREFGGEYEAYRVRVAMLIPGAGGRG